MLADFKAVSRIERDEFMMTSYHATRDQLMLAASGTFSVRSSHGDYTVREGEAFVFRTGEQYERHILSHLVIYLFSFSSETPLFEEEHIVFRDKERVRSTVKMLAGLETRLEPDHFLYRSVLFDDLILQYRMERRNYGNGAVGDPEISLFLSHLERGFSGEFSLAREASAVGLSYAQFYRRFCKAMGMSPVEYLIRLRIGKACDLLAGTFYPISEIARACGYENEFYFSNAFKKIHKISPSAYRASVHETK